MSEISNTQIGTGGFWNAINEKKDRSVVRQITPLSCVAAVGEMLLRDRGIAMTQQQIIDIIGESSTTSQLAILLNDIDKPIGEEKWHGVIVATRHLEKIVNESSFGAVLREGSSLGHLVLVEKFDEDLLTVKDPWEGTTYQILIIEFLKVWNGEIIFRWNLSK